MHTREERIFQRFGNIVMLLLSLLAIIPVLLMLTSSLTDNDTLLRNGYSFFPQKWSAYAYEWIFSSNSGTILRSYGMSFLTTAVGVALSLTLTVPLAYGLSKRTLPLRGAVTFLIFFTMLFNGGLVPTYINYTNVFHVKDTFWGLIIPNLLVSAFHVLLIKSYFVSNVPDEILEASYIDGASETRTMLLIAIPMAKPIIATVAMFVGIGYWNDWNNGFVYLVRRTDLFTIQNLLNRLMQNMQALLNSADSSALQSLSQLPSASVRMAMATLGLLPVVIVYPFIQKNFVKGITLGGVKG